MGTVWAINGETGPDISTKVPAMDHEYRKFKRKILLNSEVDTTFRTTLVQHLLSKGLFDGGTWKTIKKSSLDKNNKCVMKYYRVISGDNNIKNDNKTSDACVLAKLNVLSPLMHLRLERLRIFLRVIDASNAFVLQILSLTIDVKDSWLHHVHNDLQSFAKQSAFFHCGVDWNFPEWISAYRADKKCFKREYKICCLKCSHDNNIKDDNEDSDVLPFIYNCYDCGESFQTNAKLCHHAWRDHGYRNPFSIRITGSVCQICRHEFHTRARLLKHLGRTSKCGDIAISLPLLSEDVLQAQLILDAAHRNECARMGGSETYANLPAIYAPDVPIVL